MAAKRIKFEEAMQRLQEIVNKLESGEETLENSMSFLRRGPSFPLSAIKCWTRPSSR